MDALTPLPSGEIFVPTGTHLYNPSKVLPATTPRALELVREAEERVLMAPQETLVTHHVIHAGIYSRTICIPAGKVLTGALIKIPTMLTICGRAEVLVGDGEEVVIEGYVVLPAMPGRKQMYITHEDTFVTMSFRTNAQTVEEAEQEFTDEAERLFSRAGENVVTITGV